MASPTPAAFAAKLAAFKPTWLYIQGPCLNRGDLTKGPVGPLQFAGAWPRRPRAPCSASGVPPAVRGQGRRRPRGAWSSIPRAPHPRPQANPCRQPTW